MDETSTDAGDLLVVDFFAGMGGFSWGAKLAGARVVLAANHWPLAVRVHERDHPDTLHVCQDLHQTDFTKLPRHHLLLAAPSCQAHSPASKSKRRPYHDALRANAWVVVQAAERAWPPPEAIIVENVPAFLRWRAYPAWRMALEALGYHVQPELLTATHFGVPQRRKRLFVFCTRTPFVLADPPEGPEPAFGPCIDWDDGTWSRVTSKSKVVQQRVANGRDRWGTAS